MKSIHNHSREPSLVAGFNPAGLYSCLYFTCRIFLRTRSVNTRACTSPPPPEPPRVRASALPVGGSHHTGSQLPPSLAEPGLLLVCPASSPHLVARHSLHSERQRQRRRLQPEGAHRGPPLGATGRAEPLLPRAGEEVHLQGRGGEGRGMEDGACLKRERSVGDPNLGCGVRCTLVLQGRERQAARDDTGGRNAVAGKATNERRCKPAKHCLTL